MNRTSEGHSMQRLKAHPAVQDVDCEGLDEGRFFVHLKQGYDWKTDPQQVVRTRSFDSIKDARAAIAKAVKS